ncbi:MAG: heme ABC exporter ATP-binding protein CcmA [Proteobacteria bacterium]|nr:heme ABC exporter ATP-binding protein CcmA [Pseudomonadota bacterium]
MDNISFILKVKDVSLIFGKQLILNSLSLAVTPGEILQILGNNGVGKSSLLAIIAGLIRPNQGEVLINEQSMFSSSRSNILKRLGYLGQRTNLYHNLTILENLQLMQKCYQNQSKVVLEETINIFNLQDYQNKLISECSQGVTKRASLARTFIARPDFVLLDEPLANLDLASQDKFYDLIKSYKKNNSTVIFISHETEKLAELVTRKVLLEKGKLHWT